MIRCRGILSGVLMLAACVAPDYSPVHDWAQTASLAADYPPTESAADPFLDGIVAMQEALTLYLSAIGRLAIDGVLPYRDDPFVDQAMRAARASERGASSVAILGGLLKLATHKNYQAPEVGKYILAGDPAVQALLEELETSVDRLARDGEARAADMAQYRSILKQIGEGHSVLKTNAGQLTKAEAVYYIRNSEDQLRHAEAALPRPLLARPVAPGIDAHPE